MQVPTSHCIQEKPGKYKKNQANVKIQRKANQKELKSKRCLLALDVKHLDLMPKQSILLAHNSRVQLCVSIETVGTNRYLYKIQEYRRKIFVITKWNQFSQLRRTFTKILPIQKTQAGCISTEIQKFKASSKYRISSSRSPFLWHIQHIKVAARSTNPYMTTVFHVRSYHRVIEIQSNPQKNGSFLISLITVLTTEIIRALIQFRIESQSQ